MIQLISSACGIVILAVILLGTGLCLKGRLRPAFLVTAFLALCVPPLLLDVLPAPGEVPFVWLVYFPAVVFLFEGDLGRKAAAFLTQVFAGTALMGLCVLVSQERAVHLALTLAAGGAYLLFLNGKGREISRELPGGEGGWMGVIYAFGPCLGILLMARLPAPGAPADGLLASLTLLLCVWSFAVLFTGILAGRARSQTERDLTLARSLLEAGRLQERELSKAMESARILRHDVKHHLHVVQALLETGHTEEARKYLLCAGSRCGEGALPLYCKNSVVDALLLSFRERSREAGISFSASIQLPEVNCPDEFELCSLMGNLMENALEACCKAPPEERWISIRAVPHNSQLLICVENGFDGTVLQNLSSRKGEEGGLGIKSIRAIAGRHQGEYIPQWEGNKFTANVLIKLDG